MSAASAVMAPRLLAYGGPAGGANLTHRTLPKCHRVLCGHEHGAPPAI